MQKSNMTRRALVNFPARPYLSLISVIAIAGYNLWLKDSPDIQLLIILIILLALIGLPHGAVDPALAKKAGLWSGVLGLIKFSIGYLSISLFILGVWFIVAELAIIPMLALSAWHFSADWLDYYPRPTSVAISLAIICLPALFYKTECLEIFYVLTPLSSQMIVSGMALISISSALYATICLFGTREKNFQVLVELAILLCAAFALPPIAYFTMYFCFLHSPLHLKKSLEQLGVSEVMIYAIPFTILSLGAGACLFLTLPKIEMSFQLIQVVFVGLFALTVPHMLLTGALKQKPRRK